MVKIKRIYEPVNRTDGTRVLVDRLWPRGVSKVKADLDLWLKEIAPSNELRKWFSHDLKKWPDFRKKYLAELKANQASVAQLKKLAKQKKNLTLLYAAKDETHNEAVILKDLL